MVRDISDLLKDWRYDPEKQVRIIEATDGRSVLQIRQPLGIEQYELDGRPDGERPDGKECLVDVYEESLEEYRAEHGSDEGFVLDREHCVRLQNEAVIYYYRYLVLFQIGDFERTVRDTAHNLRICDLVNRYAESDEDKTDVLQYRPYILRINAVASAMISVSKEMMSSATELLQTAIRDIETMPDVNTPTFELERMRSISVLRATLKQVLERQVLERQVSPTAQLRRDLEKAVAEENYELAAELRDRIRSIDPSETE